MIKRLFNFGIERGTVALNPCQKGGRLYEADRSEIVWTAANLDAFYRVAPKHVVDVVELAVWTGQRQGDVLRLRWSDFDGECLRVRQSKTGVVLAIPVYKTLRAILAGIPKRGPFILTTSKRFDGSDVPGPWTEGKRCSQATCLSGAGGA